jgi:alpha-L-rhamnosidase
MKTFASVMNDAENEKKYDELTLKLQNLLRSEFWDKPVKEKMNRQTLFSTLLYHGIVPEDEIEAAKDSLLNGVKNGPSGHFNTGIFGTKYVLETLSEYVSPDSVFDIVNSTNYPGWGYMIDRGATTIWETWKESDNTYSNCHPMFGTVTEWYYRWLGGIRPDPEFPGFKEFIIAPSIPKGLESVSCNYHCPFGEIVSNWKKDQKGRFFFEMKIPPETTANVILPVNQFSEVKISSKIDNFRPEKIKGLQSGNFKLNEGVYLITVSTIN